MVATATTKLQPQPKTEMDNPESSLASFTCPAATSHLLLDIINKEEYDDLSYLVSFPVNICRKFEREQSCADRAHSAHRITQRRTAKG